MVVAVEIPTVLGQRTRNLLLQDSFRIAHGNSQPSTTISKHLYTKMGRSPFDAIQCPEDSMPILHLDVVQAWLCVALMETERHGQSHCQHYVCVRRRGLAHGELIQPCKEKALAALNGWYA
jgi:hypothetical protein